MKRKESPYLWVDKSIEMGITGLQGLIIVAKIFAYGDLPQKRLFIGHAGHHRKLIDRLIRIGFIKQAQPNTEAHIPKRPVECFTTTDTANSFMASLLRGTGKSLKQRETPFMWLQQAPNYQVTSLKRLHILTKIQALGEQRFIDLFPEKGGSRRQLLDRMVLAGLIQLSESHEFASTASRPIMAYTMAELGHEYCQLILK